MTTVKTDSLQISIKRLPHHDGLQLPTYHSGGASGFDICAATQEDVTLQPGDRALIPTGVAISLPTGFESQLRPRSGLAIKHGISLLNSPGTIDSDYRGEIQIIVINLGREPFTITRGLRIAQLVVSQHVPAHFKIVDELDVTLRDQGGFEHTGA